MKNLLIDRELTSLLNNTRLQSILAIVYIVLLVLAILSYLGIFYSMFITLDTNSEYLEISKSLITSFLGNLIIFIFLVFMNFFIGLISLIYFIIHALKNPNLIKSEDRLLWIIIIIFGNAIGIFIYWLLQIKRKSPCPVIDLGTHDI